MIESERILKEFQDRAYTAEAVAAAAENLVKVMDDREETTLKALNYLRLMIGCWRQVLPKRVMFVSPIDRNSKPDFGIADAPHMRNGELTWTEAPSLSFEQWKEIDREVRERNAKSAGLPESFFNGGSNGPNT